MRRNIYQRVKYITLLILYHYTNNMSTDFLSYFAKKWKIFCGVKLNQNFFKVRREIFLKFFFVLYISCGVLRRDDIRFSES